VSVGIERLHAYLPSWALPVDALACARRLDTAEVAAAVGTRDLAVAPPWDDTVTMAATAAARLLREAQVAPGDIGLLVVGTANVTDAEQASAVLVHELLGIHATCRAFDVRHGAYAGTAALLVAADWIRAARGRARRALVVAADLPCPPPGTLAECASGAAAVAMLVGTEPRALLLEDESGMWVRAARDACHAPGDVSAVRDEAALRSAWLDAVAGAFGAFRSLEHPEPVGEEVVTDRLARILLQLPRPALARAGHRRLLEADWRANDRRWALEEPRLERALAAAFAEQIEPTLAVGLSVGDTGAANLWLALAALLEAEGRRLGGRRLGLCAWGAGDGAEFFTGLVPATVGQVADAGVTRALAARRTIDVAVYEAARAARGTGGEPTAGAAGDFAFVGERGGRRQYVRVA